MGRIAVNAFVVGRSGWIAAAVCLASAALRFVLARDAGRRRPLVALPTLEPRLSNEQ